MTRVLTGVLEPSGDDYQPPLTVTLQSAVTASSFLELDLYREPSSTSGLLGAALWHDLGVAEGWTTPKVIRSGNDTFVSGSFPLRFLPETSLRFFARWHRDSLGIHHCVMAEAIVVNLSGSAGSVERFGLVIQL